MDVLFCFGYNAAYQAACGHLFRVLGVHRDQESPGGLRIVEQGLDVLEQRGESGYMGRDEFAVALKAAGKCASLRVLLRSGEKGKAA